MPLAQVNAGDKINASDINQFYSILKGVAASGESVTLIYNAAGSFVLQPSSDPATGTELIQVKNNAGTVQMALSSDGKVYAADGAVGSPGLAFEGEKTTGMWRAAASTLAWSLGGAEAIRLTATSLATSATGMSLQFAGSGGGMPATGNIRFNIGGTGLSITARNSANAADATLIDWNAAASNQLRLNGAAVVVNANAAAGIPTAILAGTITAGGTLNYGAQVGTSGPVIYSGSGAPTISAAVKGSLYLRTDGTTTNDRIYVAKDTAGTWASLTSAS